MLALIQPHLMPRILSDTKKFDTLQGGGIYVQGSSVVDLITCNISGNIASGVSRFPKVVQTSRNGSSPMD